MHFLFFYLEPIAFILPVGFLVFHSIKDNRARIKVLAAYYFLGSLLMWKANIWGMNNSSNLEDYRFLVLITSLSLGFYFYHCLTSSWKKALAFFLTLVNVLYYAIRTFLVQNEQALDSAGQALLSFSIVVNVLLFMHQMLSNVTEEPLSLNFDFWFVSTQMIYHCGSFLIFLSYGYFTKKILEPHQYTDENREILMQLWSGHNILLLVSSLLICCLVIWIHLRKNKLLNNTFNT